MPFLLSLSTLASISSRPTASLLVASTLVPSAHAAGPLHGSLLIESPAGAAFIFVDVETAGPNPGQNSLLSLGACLVVEPANTFYVELQPVTDSFLPEALRITWLEMENLRAHGLTPEQAMSQFADWVSRAEPGDRQPIFVALNAAFD